MQQQSTAVSQRAQVRGRPWPAGTSGNPLGARRLNERAAALYQQVRGDFDVLTNLDEVLLRQAVRLLARSERLRDPDSAIRMASEARRTLESLRRRVPVSSAPAPSFAEIAAAVQAEAEMKRAAELAADDQTNTPLVSEPVGSSYAVEGCRGSPSDEERTTDRGRPGARRSKNGRGR